MLELQTASNVAFTMANGAEVQTAGLSAVVMTAVSVANTSCCANNQDCFRGKLRFDCGACNLSGSQAYPCISLQQILNSSVALGERSGFWRVLGMVRSIVRY